MKILIVQANFYQKISDLLLKGAESALKQNNYNYDIITVPGALEIPIAIARINKTSTKYQGYIALGCIIRGETSHYDIVCNQSALGLMKLGIENCLAIGNGILTTENETQAIQRADPNKYNKGKFAVEACLSLIKV